MSMGLRAAAVFAPLCAALFFPGKVDRYWAIASIILGPIAVFIGKLVGVSFDPLFIGIAVSALLILGGGIYKKVHSNKLISGT